MPGRPAIWITVGQAPTALARCGWGCLDIFTLIFPLSPLFPSLGEGPIVSEILPERAVKPKTTMVDWLVGWLFWAGCFGHYESVFQPISGRLPEKGRKK